MYTNQMRLALRELEKTKPCKFSVDIMQHPEYIGIRVYEEDIMAYSQGLRMHIMEYLLQIKKKLESLGASQVYLEGVPGDPTRRK